MNSNPHISTQYKNRHTNFLKVMADRLEDYVTELVAESGIGRVDRISARAKDPERFDKKAFKLNDDGTLKYENPLEQIQDQIGLRIIVFYLSDVRIIEEKIINRFFQSLERKSLSPEDTWAFSYFGRHFILHLPDEAFIEGVDRDTVPFCFELQVKTLFQHAWSEASHDLVYKPMQGDLSDEDTRRLAFTAAQAWGADQIFQDLLKGLQTGIDESSINEIKIN